MMRKFELYENFFLTVIVLCAITGVIWGMFYCPYEQAHILMPQANLGFGTALMVLDYKPIGIPILICLVIGACYCATDFFEWYLPFKKKLVLMSLLVMTASVGSGWLFYSSTDNTSLTDTHIFYDGPCFAMPSAKPLPPGSPSNVVHLKCGDRAPISKDASDFANNPYILEHPGVEVNCRVSIAFIQCGGKPYHPAIRQTDRSFFILTRGSIFS